MPLSEPIVGKDGKVLSEIFVPKGTLVLVGLDASNKNKVLWGDDAHEWKPERWLAPLPDTLGKANIPGVYSHLSVPSLLHSYYHTKHRPKQYDL